MSNNQTITNLNKSLRMEMSAAHQYQLHAHVDLIGRIGEAAYSAKCVSLSEAETNGE